MNERRFSVGSIKHVLTDSGGGGCSSMNPTPVSPDGAAESQKRPAADGEVGKGRKKRASIAGADDSEMSKNGGGGDDEIDECCFRCGDVLQFKAAERSGCMTARCAKHTGKFQSRNFTVIMSMNFTV